MARKFNGTSDRILVDDALTSPSWFNDPFGRAYAGWINAPAGQSNVGIYSEGNPSNNNAFWWLAIVSASPATNKLRWAGGTAFNTPGVTSTAVIADGTWHHIALVINKVAANTSNSYFIYVDSVLDQTGVMTSSSSGGTATTATFGALHRSTTGNFLNGKLAHWGIWNRPLNAEEVRMLAQGALPSRFDPQHYFPLTGPDLEAAKDLGARHNHGTLLGTSQSADVPPLVGQPRPVKLPERVALSLIQPSSVTITLSDSGALELAADPPTIPVTLRSAIFTLAADAPTITPITVAQAALNLEADPPTLSGPVTPTPGVFALQGDAPNLSIVPPATPGVFKLQADAPHIAGAVQPITGKLVLKADAPTVSPLTLTPAKFALKGDPPTLMPLAAGSGRFTLAADPATVYPVTATSGVFKILSAGEVTSSIGVVLHGSGILRLRSDTPTVTPLTEPAPPPPPGTGGMHLTGISR